MSQHIFGLVFPGAGHAINLFNVGTAVASDDVVFHALVLSKGKGLQWLHSTGQEIHPNIRIEVIANGEWEDWQEEEPKLVLQKIMSSVYGDSVAAKIEEVKNSYDESHQFTAVIMNPLMLQVLPAVRAGGLRAYVLFPSPYYMLRLGSVTVDNNSFEREIKLRGIGDQDGEMVATVGDLPDALHPMFRENMSKCLNHTDGFIFSGTNLALEGHNYDQPQLQREFPAPKSSFFIGPLLPAWFVDASEEKTTNQTHRQGHLSSSEDSCIQFMNSQPSKSVIYISLGSHGDFSQEQALLIISILHKFNMPYIMLKRERTADLISALGPEAKKHGIITPWAPQLKILAHPSLKIFLSHGGFGSMVEGIIGGIPFITCPIASDQFIDSKVMTHLGISLGNIGLNKHRFQFDRKDLYPFLEEDEGKGFEDLLMRLLRTEKGEKELQVAREKVLDVRRRILDQKKGEGAKELETLRKVLVS